VLLPGPRRADGLARGGLLELVTGPPNRTLVATSAMIVRGNGKISSSVGDEDKAPRGPPRAPGGGLLAALERTAVLCVVLFT